MNVDQCCAEACLTCAQGKLCPERQGWPTSRRHPRTLSDAFPDVRANAIFIEPDDEPITTPEQDEVWSYVLLWCLFTAFLICITGVFVAFTNV